MPNVTPLQNDFSAGEITPELYTRSDMQSRNKNIYRAAAREIQNFWTDSRGPLRSRDGFRYIGKVVAQDLPDDNVCSVPILNTPVSSYQHPTDFQMLGNTSLDRDPNYLMIAGQDEGQCYVMEFNGSWSIKDTLTPPPGDYDNFGGAVAHSTSAGVLVVGAPFADVGGTNVGRAAVYTGSCEFGWSLSQEITAPNTIIRGLFGYAVEISEDGKVIAIAQPNNDSTPTFEQAINIYDETAPGQYQYRNRIYKNVSPSDTGMGRGGLALSTDGKVLFDGDSGHGVGATGQVIVYDDIAGVFTERQVIPAPSLAELGRDGDGYIDGANQTKFGEGVTVSDDLQSMIAHIPQFTVFGTNTRTGLNVLYTLNPDNNLYETCGSWYYDDLSTLNVGKIDMIFNADTKLLAMTKADPSGRRGGFSIHTWDFA